jgi:hypothetical protein
VIALSNRATPMGRKKQTRKTAAISDSFFHSLLKSTADSPIAEL